MSTAVKHLTDSSFEADVVNSPGIVVVDFWATWCGPCKQIAPILEEIARDMADQIVIGKIDIDENARTRDAYNVKSIPTLIVFKDGVEARRMTGSASKTRLAAFIVDNDLRA